MRTCVLLLACLVALPCDAAEPLRTIALRSGTIQGTSDTAGLPEELLAEPDAPDSGGLMLLRFHAPLGPEARESLGSGAVDWILPLGEQGFLTRVSPDRLPALQALAELAWASPYHPGLRIAPEIAGLRAGDERVVPTTIHLVPGCDVEAVTARIESLGLKVIGRSEGPPALRGKKARAARVVLKPSAGALAAIREEIARWPETIWIGRRPAYRLLNDESAWVTQSGLEGQGVTPVYDNGLFGEGQVVGVLDTGLDADMCYFRDDTLGLPPTVVGFGVGTPDPSHRKVRVVDFLWSAEDPADVTDWDTQDHGTHVAGSVLGDDPATPGMRDPGDGMAPAATLVAQDGGYAVDDCADMPAIGCPAADLTPLFDQAYRQGARIHSNSWGDRENSTPYNIYSEGSEDADAFMWEHPDFLLVFAAGNNGSGLDTVASPATAKNVLAVGATNHGQSAGSLAGFSSRGNTHDDRLKPDVTAPGVSVVSANNDGNITTDNCNTKTSSGTSMACPTAAGLAALVREYFDKGYYPGGSADAASAFVPSAALIKATLIGSARPMEDLPTPPPEPNQGWGRITLDDALFFPGDTKRLFVADVADRFASPADDDDVYTLQILDGSEPLRVVVAWTDYPSTPMASVNLVNDLDLEVESPSGSLYLGNVFSAGASVTGGTADRRNNVEVVRIQNPEPGTWTVRVRPFAIPEKHQGYALVATGRMPVTGVFLERTALGLDDSIGGDADGLLEPGEWIDLPLTLVNSGDSTATQVRAQVASLSPELETIVETTELPDVAAGAEQSSQSPHLRVRLTTALPCTETVSLRLTYSADGHQSSEDLTFDTGRRGLIVVDDFETPGTWQYVAGESTASAGAWITGNPDGTAYQPEDDVTADPGTQCLFTAANAGGTGVDDVDNGTVVARSSAYDLTGHPEARLSLHRWYANRDVGEDVGDYYRLEIRESPLSSDVVLEQLGTTDSAPSWTEVTFRIADHVEPGPQIELRVSAADGPTTGNIIEAAIDEIVFWEPECDTWNPAPNAITDLSVERDLADVRLRWTRPGIDPQHGEAASYRVYRAASLPDGFSQAGEVTDPADLLTWPDPGAVGIGSLLFYEVISTNEAGDGDTLP